MITNCIFSIGIPTINRADLLNPALEKYVVDFPETRIYVLDNGQQDIFTHPHITVMRPGKNLGVAASWNALCKVIFYKQVPFRYVLDAQLSPGPTVWNMVGPSCFWAWILNDDVYSGAKEPAILGMLEEQRSAEAPTPFMASPAGWSSFICPRSVYEDVGPFDETFYPAYFEDNDYRYRMGREGAAYRINEWVRPVLIRSSSSIEKDPSLNQHFLANRDYYTAKWGGIPEEETFREPFDGKAAPKQRPR